MVVKKIKTTVVAYNGVNEILADYMFIIIYNLDIQGLAMNYIPTKLKYSGGETKQIIDATSDIY